MEKEFVLYDQSKDLKELGFNEECFAWHWSGGKLGLEFTKCKNNHSPDVAAPLYQQVFRWFRDKHNLDSEIYLQNDIASKTKYYHYLILTMEGMVITWKSENKIKFETYEDAQIGCLKNLILTIKNK